MKSIQQQLAEAQAEIERLKKLARCKREPLAGEIGGIIQKVRESKGMTLGQMADKAGVAKGLASRLEARPGANPNWNTLVKIAAALGTRLSAIVAQWEEEQQFPMLVLTVDNEAMVDGMTRIASEAKTFASPMGHQGPSES